MLQAGNQLCKGSLAASVRSRDNGQLARLYRQIDDKCVKETIDFLLNREEAHNTMFKKAFNKVQNTGSNRDFGTTKAAKMYFSMSEPSPEDNQFSNVGEPLNSFS